MFTLMIADDNPYILNELATITDWEDFDLDLTGTYGNGRLLLQAAEQNMPDVVLTDISMPSMDGISLARALKAKSPNVKIIFISSYADFEYAQTALQLQISGYILKPFDPEQLMSTMNKVLQELRAESLRRFEQSRSLHQAETYRSLALENYMRELLYHPKEDVLVRSQLEELQLTNLDNCLLRVAFIIFDQDIEDSYSDIINGIRSVLHNRPEPEPHFILMPIDTLHCVLLLIYHEPEPDITDLLAQLNVDIEVFTGLRTAIGYSAASSQLSLLPRLYTQSREAATQSAAQLCVVGYEEINLDQSLDPEEIPRETGKNYVGKMLDYIHTNYQNPITTNDVAAAAFLSPSYANHKFSLKCGCSIFDYITSYRIDQAKRMLTETDEKITLIAERVGYSGKTSFYLAFKRIAGMSPTEYRQIKAQAQDQ